MSISSLVLAKLPSATEMPHFFPERTMTGSTAIGPDAPGAEFAVLAGQKIHHG